MDGGSRRGGAAVSRASLLSDLHAVMDQALRQAFPASYSADYCLKGRMVQAQPREAAEAHYVCEASVPLFGRLGGRGCGSAPLTPSASQSRLSASTTPLSSVGSSGDLAGMWGDSPATQPMDAHAPTPGEGAASTVWGQFAAHQPPPSPVLPSAAGLHTPSEGISSLFSDAKLQEMGEPDWAKDPDSSPLADCPQRGASPSAEAFLAHAPPQQGNESERQMLLLSEPSCLSPLDVAKEVVKHVPETPLLESVNVHSHGQIRLRIAEAEISRRVMDILVYGVQPPVAVQARTEQQEDAAKECGEDCPLFSYRTRRELVVLDYSSPNIGKEMHVGHLRTTIVGSCLSNILAFCGHEVRSINHIGDWGVNFGVVLGYIRQRRQESPSKEPSTEEGFTLADLTEMYRLGHHLSSKSRDFAALVRREVVRLQQGVQSRVQVWEQLLKVTRQNFNEVYRQLGVSLEERPESSYQLLIPEMLKELSTAGLLTVAPDSSVTMSIPESPLPLVLIKADHGYTYDTTELAALYHRLQVLRASRCVYVIDKSHNDRLNTSFWAARQAGWAPTNALLEGAYIGFMLDPMGKKIRTSAGNAMSLLGYIQEAKELSFHVLADRLKFGKHESSSHYFSPQLLRENTDRLALGTIKFTELDRNRTKECKFRDVSTYLQFSSDRTSPGVSVLMALLRVDRIMRSFSPDDIAALETEAAEGPALRLDSPEERGLALLCAQHLDAIELAARDLQPKVLTRYIHKLGNAFGTMCHAFRVLEHKSTVLSIPSEELRFSHDGRRFHRSRAVLTIACSRIMHAFFDLLGLQKLLLPNEECSTVKDFS